MDRVLRFVKMFDLQPDHESGFFSFPTYNRCTGKGKLVYVWIQDIWDYVTHGMNWSKKIFSSIHNILLVVKKMCRHANKKSFHAVLRQIKICAVQGER